MRFQFLKGHRGELGPVRKACEALGVSRPGHYECLGGRKSNAQTEREALGGFAREEFGLHKGRYGHRRMNRELRRDGITVSEKRVLAIMGELELRAKGTTGRHRRARAVEMGDPLF